MSVLNGSALAIDVHHVLAGQGIDPGGDSRHLAVLRPVAERVLLECRQLLQPRVASKRLQVVSAGEDCLRLEGGASIDDAGVAARLCGSSEVTVAVCTVGEAISRHAGLAIQDDLLTALAIEGLACAGVEALAASFYDAERARAEGLGLRVTPRLSPGMEGWPLDSGQRAIFGIVNAAAIGVRLTESWQMYPTKSASFVLGIGANVWQDAAGNCARCGARERCAWRSVAEGGSSVKQEAAACDRY